MTQPPPLIDALRRLAGPGSDDRPDSELLARFVGGDPAAFAVLVQRHGRLVWGACRRRAPDPHAAEDAFQTTFLALARNAAAVRKPGALGAWLHRVAVRCTATLRTNREPMSALPTDLPTRDRSPAAAATGRDLERAIDAEIDALPEHYRLAFVLCEVEEKSAADAAAALGCPVGTIESRLTRARERLRARLARRGITAGALVGLGLSTDAVPASARSAAIALGTGVAPASMARAALADRVVRAPVAGPVTVGLGLAGSGALLIGLGSLLWAQDRNTEFTPPLGQPIALRAPDLPRPLPDQFHRDRRNFPLPPEAIARIGDPWLRHAVTPDRLAFSADGRFLATGAAGDRWLRVWDLAAGQPRVHLLLGPGEEPVALALSSDARSLRAVIRTTGAAQLREYDTTSGRESRREPVAEPKAAVFDPTGEVLALALPGEVRVFQAAPTAERWRIANAANAVADVAFAGPDRLAVLAPDADRVRLFDPATGVPVGELVEPGARLAQPAFSADGRTMAVWLPMPNQIHVWDVAERRISHTIVPTYPPTSLGVAPHGSEVAMFTAWSGATLWKAAQPNDRPVRVESFGGKGGRFSPDGSTLAVLSHESHLGKIELVDGRTGAARSAAESQGPLPQAFESDGAHVLLRGLTHWIDWPTAGEDRPRVIAPWKSAADTPWVNAEEWGALSPDRSVMARSVTVNENEDEYALDIVDGITRARRLRIPLENAPHRPTFSPDGRTVYAVVDQHVYGWDVATGQQVIRGNQPAGELVYRLIASPDGKFLATAVLVLADRQRVGSIQVWDAATGASLISAEAGHARPFIAFSADGKRFAAAVVPDRPGLHPSEVRVWELESQSVAARFPGYDGQPAFSPDGRTLAITRDDRVELVEFATGQVRHAFRHDGPVEPAIVWRPDGRVLASASPEAPVYLWDVAGDRTGPARAWEPARNADRWAALSGTDGRAAFDAIRQAWAHPVEAADFFRTRMPVDADARLAGRACEALELPAAAAGKTVLAEWAAGPPAAPRTREATESLHRLSLSPGRGRG
jgi:RNA polymerase sigma factor (sigma-70 family)